jgi:hypothetical protein
MTFAFCKMGKLCNDPFWLAGWSVRGATWPLVAMIAVGMRSQEEELRTVARERWKVMARVMDSDITARAFEQHGGP